MLKLYRQIICNGIRNRRFNNTSDQLRVITQLLRNYGDGNYNLANQILHVRGG